MPTCNVLLLVDPFGHPVDPPPTPWERQAETVKPPAQRWVCRCGTSRAAMTPEVLALAVAAHRAKCHG